MAINEEKLIKESKNLYTFRYSFLNLTRPMTFTGTISPILAGTLLAAKKESIHFDRFLVFLLSALFIQASINMLNDYYDFKNGQDFEKWILTKDKSIKQGPKFKTIPFIVFGMLLFAAVLGVWLAFQSSFWIIVIGAVGILFGIFYSAGSHSLSSMGFGEITAAIFLGIVPTILAYMIQGIRLNSHIFSLSLPFAFLISTMILSNNIRDFEKDQSFRCTLALRLGRVKAHHLLTALLSLAYILVLLLIYFHVLSISTGIVGCSIPLAIRLRWSLRPGAKREDEVSAMKWAARHHWAFGLLFSFGILLSIVFHYSF